MSERETPQTVLQHYFDELLQDDFPSVADLEADAQRQRQRLQRLLHSAAPTVVAEKTETVNTAPPVVATETVVSTQTVAPTQAVQPEPVIATPPVVELAEPVNALESLPDVPVVDGLEWEENGRPQWAQKRFDVLLFTVSGLTLAVPLIALGQIQPLTDELTPLRGQADWFMGLQPTPNGKVRTVNTAKFVMPERYDPRFVETARYVVSINGVPWGLAVDSVNQPISLGPEDVKWRSERSKRPWLAGTVKAHMCALLDIPRIGQMLVAADRNARPR